MATRLAIQLVLTLERLKAAAGNGEMDAAIEVAGTAIRKGFRN
jgi:hypothetical protein